MNSQFTSVVQCLGEVLERHLPDKTGSKEVRWTAYFPEEVDARQFASTVDSTFGGLLVRRPNVPALNEIGNALAAVVDQVPPSLARAVGRLRARRWLKWRAGPYRGPEVSDDLYIQEWPRGFTVHLYPFKYDPNWLKDLLVPILQMPAVKSDCIEFAGQDYPVKSPAARRVFQELVRANGTVVPSRDIQNLPGMRGKNIGRFLKGSLPDSLYLLIGSKSGKSGGYYLKLESTDSND
jgi:hypothetical protein